MDFAILTAVARTIADSHSKPYYQIGITESDVEPEYERARKLMHLQSLAV